MPKNIRRFLWLYLAENIVSLYGIPFGPEDERTMQAYLAVGIIVSITTLFVWLAAFQRQNWARWVFVILVAWSAAGFVAIYKTSFPQYSIFVGAQFVSLILDFVALYFLFSEDVQQWFKRETAT